MSASTHLSLSDVIAALAQPMPDAIPASDVTEGHLAALRSLFCLGDDLELDDARESDEWVELPPDLETLLPLLYRAAANGNAGTVFRASRAAANMAFPFGENFSTLWLDEDPGGASPGSSATNYLIAYNAAVCVLLHGYLPEEREGENESQGEIFVRLYAPGDTNRLVGHLVGRTLGTSLSAITDVARRVCSQAGIAGLEDGGFPLLDAIFRTSPDLGRFYSSRIALAACTQSESTPEPHATGWHGHRRPRP